jgi:heat shock protein HslJ
VVSGFSGCNTYRGKYTVKGNVLTVTGIAATLMACPSPGLEIEKAFLAALGKAQRYSIVPGRLEIENATSKSLVFEAEPLPTLEGVTWNVLGFNNGRQVVVSPIGSTTLTITFDNGAISGNAGCNTFRGRYTVEDGKIAIGPVAATRKMCEKDVMEQERQFLAALEMAETWAIENGDLDLRTAAGARAIQARGASTP